MNTNLSTRALKGYGLEGFCRVRVWKGRKGLGYEVYKGLG